MKLLALFLLAFISISGVNGQDDLRLSKSELKQLQKEQKKAEQEVREQQMAELVHAMVTYRQFVLEADYLSDKYGSRISVQSNINFILVDSLEGTIQLGSAMTVGYNGVGGTTIEGTVNNYKYTIVGKNKNSYSVSFNFMSSFGTYDIALMVGSDGNASATIKGNWSGSLSYHGKLVPISVTRTYKGSPIR